MERHGAAQPHSPSHTASQPAVPLRLARRPNSRVQLARNIRISLTEGSAFSLMVGVGETYLPAFLLWMGLGNVAAGLITTLPMLAGSCLQLVAPFMVQRLGSYRRWVLVGTSIQGLSFIPLIACALVGKLPLWIAFACASVYWSGGLGASGAWNSWMGTLIPPSVQVGFFTKRTRITQGMVFVGFALGALVLHEVPRYADKSWAFVAIFSIAFFCRFFSVYWLSRQSEPVFPSRMASQRFGMQEFFHRLSRNHEQGRLFTYMLSVTFSAHLAAPFFTAYMLSDMKLSYTAYAVLIACSYTAKVLAIPFFGKLAGRKGTRPLLTLGGYGIVLLPVLWLVSHHYGYLMALQALSGFTWGAYELASLLLIWELVKVEERTCAMTTYNLCSAAAMSAGSLIGGFLLSSFGSGASAFVAVFFLSTFARGGTLFLLKGIAHHRYPRIPFALRVLSIRPAAGFLAFIAMAPFRRIRRSKVD